MPPGLTLWGLSGLTQPTDTSRWASKMGPRWGGFGGWRGVGVAVLGGDAGGDTVPVGHTPAVVARHIDEETEAPRG